MRQLSEITIEYGKELNILFVYEEMFDSRQTFFSETLENCGIKMQLLDNIRACEKCQFCENRGWVH